MCGQSCPTLCNPMDHSPPAHPPLSMGFSRQKYWSWIAISFSTIIYILVCMSQSQSPNLHPPLFFSLKVLPFPPYGNLHVAHHGCRPLIAIFCRSPINLFLLEKYLEICFFLGQHTWLCYCQATEKLQGLKMSRTHRETQWWLCYYLKF